MATWVSITSVGAGVAGQFERDLRLALCLEPGLQIAPFQFDAAVGEAAPSQVGKAFATFLARQPGLVGVIWYEMEALGLIEFAPAHLTRVFALAEIAGWRSAQPLMARADIVGNLLNRNSPGERVGLCAPQTRAFSSIAQAMFPGKIIDAPIPIAAAAGVTARDEGLSLGIPPDMSPQGWETFAPFVTALAQPAATGTDPPVRLYAPAEFFTSPYFWLLRDVPGVAVIEGLSPDNRTYAGGDFLIATAPDAHQLDMIARDAAVAGAAVLILDGDTAQPTGILDAAGAPAPLERLRTDPDFRSALREAFRRRAARVSGQSKAFWRSVLLGEGPSGPNGPVETLVDGAVYSALTDRGALADETAASRAFLIAPASAERALTLAGALARADPAAAWPLVALANRLARGTADTPARPPALDIGGGRLFVTDEDGPRYSREQRAALQKWLDDLPAAPREAIVTSGALPPFPNPASGDGAIAYSAGLSRQEDGRHRIAAGGALLLVKSDEPSATGELVVVMDVSLVGEEPVGRMDVQVIGRETRTIDLTSNAPRRVEIRASPPRDPALGIVVRLIPRELRWAHVLLTSVSVQSAEPQHRIRPEALASVGFDLLETLPITAAVISGAFGVEQDGDGRDFRWVSRELILALPARPSTPPEAECRSWLVLKLRANPSSNPSPLAADIDFPGAGGDRGATALRRLGAFDGDALLGAPIGPQERSGVARITLRSPSSPLSSMDSRLAAACLTDLWIASPSSSGCQAVAPRFVPLNVTDGGQFATGWYPIEAVKGLPSRWMSRQAVVSSGHRPRAGSRMFLALAGPWLPKDNPSLVPFAVVFDGRPMSVRARTDSPDGWAWLFEGETLDDAFGADFELTAETARVLGPADPREASILTSFATLIDPAGDATGAFGDAEVMNCALTIEHWGAGLSGAWLPSGTIMVCARSAQTDDLVIEGAAATDVATLEGLAVEIDGKRVKAKLAVGKDGGWTLRAALGQASQGAALLLRLTAPKSGRVMLRRVGFERAATP